MSPDNKLGDRIRIAIKNSEYQANEIAEYVGVTPQAISQAIRKNAMRESNLRKLAEKTGVDVDWLIFGDRTLVADFDIDLFSRCVAALHKAAKELDMKELDEAEVTQAAYRLYNANH